MGQDRPIDDWGGLLKELAEVPGADAHAIHARLSECVPFFAGAIEAADGSTTSDALVHLQHLLFGTRP